MKQVIFVVCNPVKVLEKGILPLETHSVALQFFLDLENEDKFDACLLHVKANKCCLLNLFDVDCDTVKLIGNHEYILKPKDRKTFLFFYVTMFQLNHEGYCNFDLIHRCGYKTPSKAEDILISFDTRLHKKDLQYLLRNYKRQMTSRCKSTDEDPLHECRPVNCDIKYAGMKPFYDKKKNRCVEAAKCISDPYKNLPDLVYEPTSNTCKDLDHALSVTDIYAINSGMGTIIEDNMVNSDNVNLVVFKPNCTTISQNAQFLKDLISGKFYTVRYNYIDLKQSCNDAMVSIFSCLVGISVVIILCVCCTNAAMIVHAEWKTGRLHKKVIEFKHKMKSQDDKEIESEGRQAAVNNEVTSKLLKEVVISDLPLDLRDSVVDICERIGREVRWKRRYRMIDDGSDINLRPVRESSDTSTTSDLDISEKERIMK